MKVFVQITSTNEKICLEVNPSDDIRRLKTKLFMERAIPEHVQKLTQSFFGKNILSNETKIAQLEKQDSDSDYLSLYLCLDIELQVKTLSGQCLVISFEETEKFTIWEAKRKIFSLKGYPSALQKLYLNNSNIDELRNEENILSAQIVGKIINHGMILGLSGNVPIRSIAKNSDNKVISMKIDAMESVSEIKQQISHRFKSDSKFHLYLDGKDIERLEDHKKLFEYDITSLLQSGLLIKPFSTQILISYENKKFTIECDSENSIDILSHMVGNIVGIPPREIRMVYNGKRFDYLDDGRTLNDFDIENGHEMECYPEQCGE